MEFAQALPVCFSDFRRKFGGEQLVQSVDEHVFAQAILVSVWVHLWDGFALAAFFAFDASFEASPLLSKDVVGSAGFKLLFLCGILNFLYSACPVQRSKEDQGCQRHHSLTEITVINPRFRDLQLCAHIVESTPTSYRCLSGHLVPGICPKECA